MRNHDSFFSASEDEDSGDLHFHRSHAQKKEHVATLHVARSVRYDILSLSLSLSLLSVKMFSFSV